MLSIQQTAILAARSLGGYPADFDGTVAAINSLSPDLEIALTAAIGAQIRANPTEYTPAQVSVANAMAGLSGQPLADEGFSVRDFVSAVGDEANDLIITPLVNVGQSASAVARALPLIAIVVGAYLLVQWTKSKAPAA